MAGFIAFAQYKQGKREAEDAKNQAAVNAAIARDDAEQKAAAGRLEAERIRRNAIRLTKEQKTGFAKAGVTTEGTPIDIMIQSAGEEELNAQQTQRNFEVARTRSINQSSMILAQGKNRAQSIRTSANIAAGTTLLNAVASAG